MFMVAPTPTVTVTATATQWVLVQSDPPEPLWHFGGWGNVWQGLIATLIASGFAALIARLTVRWTGRHERELRAEDRNKVIEEIMEERSREAARLIGGLLGHWAAEIAQLALSDHDGLKRVFGLGPPRMIELESSEPPLQREELRVLVVSIRRNLLDWYGYVTDPGWRPTATSKHEAEDLLRQCSVLFKTYGAGRNVTPEEVNALARPVAIDIREIFAAKERRLAAQDHTGQ